MLKSIWNIYIFANGIASLLLYAAFSYCLGQKRAGTYFVAVANIALSTVKIGHKKGWAAMPIETMHARNIEAWEKIFN